jgi:hypothetical protein
MATVGYLYWFILYPKKPMSAGHLVFTTPSNTWQDYLNLRMSLESGLRSQAHSKPSSQNPTSDQPLQSRRTFAYHNNVKATVEFRNVAFPEVSAPKPLSLQTSFQFPISSTVGTAQQMNVGACGNEPLTKCIQRSFDAHPPT